MAWLRQPGGVRAARGHYAAPIGWIDMPAMRNCGLAIRSGRLRGDQLELTAGAGLVKGSSRSGTCRRWTRSLGGWGRVLAAATSACHFTPSKTLHGEVGHGHEGPEAVRSRGCRWGCDVDLTEALARSHQCNEKQTVGLKAGQLCADSRSAVVSVWWLRGSRHGQLLRKLAGQAGALIAPKGLTVHQTGIALVGGGSPRQEGLHHHLGRRLLLG